MICSTSIAIFAIYLEHFNKFLLLKATYLLLTKIKNGQNSHLNDLIFR